MDTLPDASGPSQVAPDSAVLEAAMSAPKPRATAIVKVEGTLISAPGLPP